MPIQNLSGVGVMTFDLSKDFIANPGGFTGQHFFWDGREQQLEKLILQPVGNHIEMGITDVDALIQKLSALPYYAPLFNDAFGSPEITEERISQAVTTFISSINTNNTRFDRYNMVRFTTDPATGKPMQQDVMSPLEIEGMLLFQGKS